MNSIKLTETEKGVITPFIKANNLVYPVFLEIGKNDITLSSYKTKLKLSFQEAFFIKFYLKGKFPKNTRFKFADENYVEIME